MVRGARKRAIWVNIPFSFIYTESVGNQLLLAPEDWEAQFGGNANETAVLRAIRGAVYWHQTVAGTLGTAAFWGIYISDKDATVVPTFSVAGMADVDWLWTDTYCTQGTVSGTGAAVQRQQLEIKSKRRLKSRDAVYICAQFGTDLVSPAGIIGGIARFLVARD